jgi:uncharacterized DUF497 family protein
VFEYDPAKSASNKNKHGIDFEEAQALWLDERRLTLRIKREALSEERWVVVGRIGDRIWATVVTYREEIIRIISVRRARDNEVEWYERKAD